MRNSTASPLKPYETAGTDSSLPLNPLSSSNASTGTSIPIPQRDSSVTLNYNNSLSRGWQAFFFSSEWSNNNFLFQKTIVSLF